VRVARYGACGVLLVLSRVRVVVCVGDWPTVVRCTAVGFCFENALNGGWCVVWVCV